MNSPTRTRLIDIANALGVSKVTVSKALRDHPDISPEMTQRVKDMAKQMDYRPNVMARVLSSRESKLIGVVLPEIVHTFFAVAMDGIYRAAAKHGYEIVLTVSREDPEEEATNIRHLMAMHVDGILAAPSHHTTDTAIYQEVKEQKLPFVFFDRFLEFPKFSKVTVDDRQGAKEIVAYAIQKGYQSFGHLAGYMHRSIFRDRQTGFQDALVEADLELKSEWVIECGVTEEDGYRGLEELIQRGSLPEALFTVNDPVAFGVYEAARKHGIRIPQDMAVLGFSNIPFGRYLSPPLTTVHQDAEALGCEAFRLLLKEISNPNNSAKEHVIIPTKLIIRESC